VVLDRRDPAANAEVVATAGQLVGRAKVLDHTHRVVQREQLDHWAQPDVRRDLRRSGAA
jgi:hypothetical protein